MTRQSAGHHRLTTTGSWRRPDREEEGAILSMTAGIAVLVLLMAAFAVDLGVQRVAIRDMQALADAAAMDAARELPLTDCAAGAKDDLLTAIANDTKGRHGDVIGDDDNLVASAGHLDAQGAFVTGPSGGLCDAVRVTSATSVTRAFVAGSGDAVRSAVGARGTPEVCFSVGSFLASLNTSEVTLLPTWFSNVLGVDATVLSSDGIVDLKNVDIPLADVAAELGVGSAQGLLDTQVTALRVAQVAAELVDRSALADAGVDLDTLVAALAASARVQDAFFAMSDVLSLDTTSGSALSSSVNVLDLLAVAIEAAGSDASAPAYQVSAAGALPLRIDLVHPAKLACGRANSVNAVAQSSQVVVRMNVPLNLTNLNVAGLAEAKLAGTVPLEITVANVEGRLSSVRCAADDGVGSIDVLMSGEGARIDGRANLDFTVRILFLPITLSPVLAVGGAAVLPEDELLALEYVEGGGLPAARYGGDVDQLLDLNASLTFPPSGLLNTVLGVTTGGLLGLTNALVPLVTEVLAAAAAPVLNLLTNGMGIDVAGAEVKAAGRPSCKAVTLIDAGPSGA